MSPTADFLPVVIIVGVVLLVLLAIIYYRSNSGNGGDSHALPLSKGRDQNGHRTHLPDSSYPSAPYIYPVQGPTRVQRAYHRPVYGHDSHGPPPSPRKGQSDYRTHIPDYSYPSASYTYPVQDLTRVQRAYHRPADVSKPLDQPVQREYDSANAKQGFELQKIHSSPTVEYWIDSKSPPAAQDGHQNDLAEDSSEDDDTEQDWSVLRDRANQEGDMMAQCSRQSQEAYQRGDKTLAKQLSVQKGKHRRKMEGLNNLASAQIFKAKNPDGETGRVDLHNLYVKEALSYAEKAIEKAREQSRSQIQFIVGKGLHSEGNEAKIKPALKELLEERGIQAVLDPNNAGILIAHL